MHPGGAHGRGQCSQFEVAAQRPPLHAHQFLVGLERRLGAKSAHPAGAGSGCPVEHVDL